MSWFRRTKPDVPQPPLRRRPLPIADEPSRPSRQMFSYHSQRSANQQNIGRRDVVAESRNGDTVSQTATVHSRGYTILRRRTLLPIGLVLLIGLAYASTLGSSVKVILLQDTASAYFLQDSHVYAQAAENSLESSIFNRNKLTVNTAAVRLKLLKDYPEIQDVSLHMPLIGHQAQVYIQPNKPSFILTTTAGTAFLLDSNGRALATSSVIPDISRLQVPTLQDRTGRPVKLGDRAIPSTTVNFVQTVVSGLKAEQVAATSLSLPAGAYELDVAITGKPYYVKFNLQNDARQQVGAYLAAKAKLESDKTVVGQYFDVRVPERVYYK